MAEHTRIFAVASIIAMVSGACMPRLPSPDEGLFSLVSSPARTSTPAALGPGFAVGGTIFGEVPTGLSVSISGGSGCGAAQAQSPAVTGSYSFATDVPDGCSGATVAVTTQPPGKYCSSYNTTVSIAGAAVTNVDLYCFAIEAPAGPLAIPEYTNQTISIRLTFSPGPSSVIVTPTSSDGAVTVSAPLTFTSANFNAYQNVTVAAIADANSISESATVAFEVNTNQVASLTANASDGTPLARYLVVSSNPHSGDFANDFGLTGANWAERADSFCNANLPAPVVGTGIYRAVLNGLTSRTGTAGAQVNWPLRAGVPYLDQDGSTVLAVANANNLFDIPLINNFPLGGNYWTGAADATAWGIGNTCADWSNVGSNGDFGIGTFPNASFFSQGNSVCAAGKTILCAQDVKDTGNGTISSTRENITWMKCNFGETWDSGTNTCTGGWAHHQFCVSDTFACETAGVLNGLNSQIYDDCDGLVLGGKSNWRVPTPLELAAVDLWYQAQPAFFPTLDTGTYYWSNTSQNATQAKPYWFGLHTDGTAAKTDTGTILRCVADGL